MKCKIIICTLIKDCFNETLLGTTEFIENGTHYFEIPRDDFRKCKDARIKITVSETGS